MARQNTAMVNELNRSADRSFRRVSFRASVWRDAVPWTATLLLAALANFTPRATQAQTMGTSTATGSGLTVKTEWWNVGPAAGGYCPVRITVNNATKNPRRLRFVFDANYPRDMEISQTIELDPNTQAAFTLSVPMVSYNMYGSLRVYERSRELDKLRMFGVAGSSWWGGNAMPTILLVARSSPDLRNLTEAASRIESGSSNTQGGYQVLVVPAEKLPPKWIDYSLLDVVMLSTQQLDQLTPESREAIIAWTMSGGNLFVYGARDGENSPELIRLLDLENRSPRGAEWRPPRSEDHNTEMVFAGQGGMIWTGRGPRRVVRTAQPVLTYPGATPAATEQVAPTDAQTDKTETSNFRIRPFGLGQLIVSSVAEPFPGAVEDWAWTLKTFGPNRLYWAERHGISARSENDDFWLFLIPGVGRAPVLGFQALITLFAVLIGPVNYFVLRRQRKLYFLIITVPTVALATTFLLLGYAMASDGFALRSRVRSVTMLDQRRGESVSWTRISYYAGMAPSGGLRFSRDTAVYPILPTGAGNNQSVHTDWTDEQTLTSGWLRARTPTQLLTVTHRTADEQLAIGTEPGSNKMRMTNHLGANLLGLLVLAEDGNFYATQDIASNGSALLEPQSLDDAVKPVKTLIAAQKLELPEEMQAAQATGGLFGPRRGRGWGWNQFTPTNTGGSVIESVIQTFAGDAKELQSFLPPRSYIAIVEKPPLVDLGVQKTEDYGSLYVIWGLY
jgi:hypothetical protein